MGKFNYRVRRATFGQKDLEGIMRVEEAFYPPELRVPEWVMKKRMSRTAVFLFNDSEFVIKTRSVDTLNKRQVGLVSSPEARGGLPTWLRRFSPETFWVAETLERAIIGYITGVRINFNPSSPPVSRAEALGYTEPNFADYEGYKPKGGNALYVASIGVLPSAFRKGVGTALIRETIEFVEKNNLKYRVAGLRIPGYHKVRNVYSAGGYIRSGQEKSLIPYERLGFKLLAVKKDYYPRDKESCGYGALYIWEP